MRVAVCSTVADMENEQVCTGWCMIKASFIQSMDKTLLQVDNVCQL